MNTPRKNIRAAKVKKPAELAKEIKVVEATQQENNPRTEGEEQEKPALTETGNPVNPQQEPALSDEDYAKAHPKAPR